MLNMKRKLMLESLNQIGYKAGLEGKPINSFYELPIRHKESERAAWEIGWREGKKNLLLMVLKMKYTGERPTHEDLSSVFAVVQKSPYPSRAR